MSGSYLYFHGRPPALTNILERPDSFRCRLWREADLSPVFDAPAQLSMTERLTLFSLVLGRRPERAVEIGSFCGGSAQIITHAMDLNDFGHLTLIEPEPQFAPEVWQMILHRSALVQAPSPGAFERIEGTFDFAFIDAMHTEENVRADLVAVADRLRPGGVVLLHDALHPEVRSGIADALAARPSLIDCGSLCTNASFDENGVSWAGLGMIRMVERKQP